MTQREREVFSQIIGQSLTPQQAHDAYTSLVCEPSAQGDSSDDLLFFVHLPAAVTPQSGPFAVRRRQDRGLPSEFVTGPGRVRTAWDKTVELYLVLRATYQLTVVACSQSALPAVAEGKLDGEGVRAVVKRVYASPSQTPVNLRKARADAPPQPCYPNVCFAVDHEDEAFDAMVIERPDDAYCVLLHSVSNDGQAAQQRTQLFSGYVTQHQVASYLSSSRGGRGGPDKVMMNGPGGVGQSEVAVRAVPAAQVRQPGGQPRPLTALLQRGLKAVSTLLGEEGSDQSIKRLQCGLLTLVLPVDALCRMLGQAHLAGD